MKQALVAAPILLAGCMPTQVGSIYPLVEGNHEGRDIFVTIDGTGNRQTSRTNAARLFEMVDARSGVVRSRGLATYYAEGVGSTKGDLAGLALGVGMSEDVRNAYEFLTVAYAPDDRIFLSGFSRGAYAVRVLNGLIALAGIPDLSDLPRGKRQKIVGDLFRAYKSSRRKDETLAPHNARRIAAIGDVLKKHGVEPRRGDRATIVEAMAIWDTVEAIGWPDGTENPAENLTHYYITSCNVKHVFHALSLDDNRAYSFTPIFAAGPLMHEGCEESAGDVQEVWFAGAHADVGGSYAPGDLVDGYLPGVSMTWMLDRLRHYDLFDPRARVFADPNGPIHDAKAGNPAYKLLYRNFRDPLRYHEAAKVPGRPKVHFTVFERLARAKEFDSRWQQCQRKSATGDEPSLLCSEDLKDYGFVPELSLAGCIRETSAGYDLVAGQTCVTVVCDRFHPFSRFCTSKFKPEWPAHRPTRPVHDRTGSG